MSQVNLADRASSTFLGIESTYGTTPTMTRVFPEQGATLSCDQANLENSDEREHLFKTIDPVQGLKTWSASLTFKLRPDGTQLTSAASPSATPAGLLGLKAAWGGEAYAAGSTIASAASGAQFTVASGHGSRFKIGQLIAVEISNALEVCRVTNVSTDTLSVWPTLSGTPQASDVVINSFCYWPTQDNDYAVTLQHAKALASAAHKWTCNGARASASLALTRGEILRYTLKLDGTSWSFPSGDSIAVTAASDGQAAPHVARDAICLLQTPATTTRTNYPLHGVELAVIGDDGNVMIPELGGVEGVTGVMRTGGRPFVKVTVTHRADTARQTAYESQDALSLLLAFPRGSAETKRFVVVDVPRLVPDGPPKQSSQDGRWVYAQGYVAELDASTTTSGLSGDNYDLAVAPIRVAVL